MEKKKLFIIIGSSLAGVMAIVTVILLLTANSGKNSTDTLGSGQLVYWGLWEPSSVMQPLIDEFEAQHTGITILYSQQTFTNYESRLYTRLAQASNSSEPAPDIFRIHNTWLPKYYQYLYPLPSSIMSKTTYASTFYPTAVSDFTAKDGNIYAMPLEIDGLVVFFNKQILSNAGVTTPPTDWDSFVELAQKLTIKNGSGQITQSGLAMGTANNVSHSAEIVSFLMLEQGIDIIDDARTTVTLNTKAVQGVFNTYTSFAMGDDATWSSTLGTDLTMFEQGKLAMLIAPSWRAFDIIQAAPSIEFGMATLPQLAANSTPVYFSTYWGEAVNKNTSNPTAAWTFINFLAQKEQQQQLFSNESKIRAFGEPYSRTDLNSDLLSQSYTSAIATSAPNMVSWQMGDESYVKASINEAITAIVANGQATQAALINAQTEINTQLAQTNK